MTTLERPHRGTRPQVDGHRLCPANPSYPLSHFYLSGHSEVTVQPGGSRGGTVGSVPTESGWRVSRVAALLCSHHGEVENSSGSR